MNGATIKFEVGNQIVGESNNVNIQSLSIAENKEIVEKLDSMYSSVNSNAYASNIK